MKIDVLIEYDPKSSEVTFSSKAAQYTETRTARIGFSRPKNEDISLEQIEFVGEDWEIIQKIEDCFPNEPTRKDRSLRVVNPFELATFEPVPAFRMVHHFIRLIQHKIYPKPFCGEKLFHFLIGMK